ncbi:MAG: D-alanyl-D-alanine carboxypeptidase, partial [Candidatus Blackburnbacteria bacterium]|nr:D-alanyl-D-alanine carboxypeptidase [Candidatus Blackburnbacteria bacterium]
IGLENTNFKNPVGFDEYLHFSTAEDLVKVAAYAIGNPVFSEIVSTQEVEVKSTDGKTVHKLNNINELLGKVPGVIGVKTGWTVNAGEALVTLVERDGNKVMLSVLSSDDRFGETEKLIDWIFKNYEWK